MVNKILHVRVNVYVRRCVEGVGRLVSSITKNNLLFCFLWLYLGRKEKTTEPFAKTSLVLFYTGLFRFYLSLHIICFILIRSRVLRPR